MTMANENIKPIPQPKGYPLIGNLLEIDPYFPMGFQTRLADLYGEIYSLQTGGPRIIFVNSHELANELCDEKRFSKKIGGGLKEVRNGVGDGIFTAYPGEHSWGVAHRILMPAFGPLTMRGMFDEMHDIAVQLSLKWARAGSDFTINAPEDFTRLTMDTIALCAMDYRFNSFYSQDLHPFLDAMSFFLSESGARSQRPGLVAPLFRSKDQQYWDAIAVLRKTSDEVVAHRRAHPSDRKDLLNAMLNGRDSKTGEQLTDSIITNNLITFLIAGHETTSSLLSFSFYELLKHPQAYERAQQEVDEIVGQGPITVDHLSKFKFIAAVLRESLRLHSPLTGLSVTPLEDTVIKGKYAIQKDEPMTIVLNRLHRDPKVYGDDALEWKAERMLDEPFNALPKNSWKPFGNGVRACIGRPFAWQEALLVMAMLLQNFNFYMHDPSYNLVIKQTATIKPKDFYMKASLRHGNSATKLEQALRGGNVVTADDHEKSKPTSKIAEPASKGKPMALFYGSNTGTCESFANRLAGSASSHGFQATVAPLDAAKENLRPDRLNVIVTASYEGEPPDNASHFVTWLETLKGQELKDVPFIVFGCGHSDWTNTFQRIPKLVEQKIEECGGKRIADRGLANAAAGDMFSEFEVWEDDVFWPSIQKNYGGEAGQGQTSTDGGLDVEISHTRASLRQDVSAGKVISKRTLTAPGAPPKMNIEIQLPTDMEYRAGDYLAVLPTNHKDNVERAMRYFGLNWDSSLTVSTAGSAALPTNTPLPAKDVFSAYVELTQPATKRNLATLIGFAQEQSTKDALKRTLEGDFAKQISEKRIAILDLLETYPDIKLPLGHYLAMVPPMRIRQYSISSSPLESPERCTLTFAVLEAPAFSGHGTYRGTASNYLATLEPGDLVHVSIKQSHASFHLPTDSESVPLIMVAAGTGLAPFRGFVQERSAQIAAGRKLAPAMLFHGCRAQKEDAIHADEFDKWEKAGAVNVFRAFSRHPEDAEGCKYVQDRLWKERKEARELFKNGARMYVCGSGPMGEAVKKVVQDVYIEGNKAAGKDVGADEAEKWMDSIRSERYAVDVFT